MQTLGMSVPTHFWDLLEGRLHAAHVEAPQAAAALHDAICALAALAHTAAVLLSAIWQRARVVCGDQIDIVPGPIWHRPWRR